MENADVMQERIDLFASGQWQSLLDASDECARVGVASKVRASRRPRQDNIQSRVQRAEALAQMGELSAGRQALEGADVAPGNLATLAQLTNPVRRPPIPRDHLSGSATAVPVQPFDLDPELFCKNVRSGRRGAAPGPSGMTVEHLLGLVDSDHDMEVFASFAGLVSQGVSPEAFWKGSDLVASQPFESLMVGFAASLLATSFAD